MADCVGSSDQDIAASSLNPSTNPGGEETQVSNNGESMSASTLGFRSPSHKGEQEDHNSSSSISGGDGTSKKERDKDRDERIRLAKEKQTQERQRKLDELRESQRQAQEHRTRQQELRRLKIEELRRREDERRAAVEERRRKREEIEQMRREAILAKTTERLARYEEWKANGKGKGGVHGPFGFGSRTPRDICRRLDRARRAASQGAIYRRSPNDSDSDSYIRCQRRAISACSTVRRHCCIDLKPSAGIVPGYIPPSKRLSASTSVLYQKRSQDLGGSAGNLNTSMKHLSSTHALGTIPENRSFLAPHAATPHRPRSTVGLHMMANTPTSRSIDSPNRPARKPRPASIAGFVSLTPPTSVSSPRSKSTERLNKDKPRARPQSMGPERKKKEEESEKANSDKDHSTSTRGTLRRSTASVVDRLSVPKHARNKPESPKDIDKAAPGGTPHRKSPRQPRKPRTPARKEGKENKEEKEESTPVKTPQPVPKPRDKLHTPKTTREHTPVKEPAPASTPATAHARLSAEGEHPNINKPMTVEEEYKVKMAENRRQAREKAEREAEEERLKIEEERVKEEEKRHREEEEQRRMEEESMRLAEEARRAEDERLRKAIEAEDLRRKEEAARLEEERIAKEEAEKKAKEEAERVERERQEKARRDEEERLERKKRLEMIMKRVKTDPALDTNKELESPIKSNQGSPVKSSASGGSSGDDKTDEDGETSPEDSNAEEEPDKPVEDKVTLPEDERRPKFSSPLLQQLMEKRGDEYQTEDRPKFKSPLLQNLLGKSKSASRVGNERSDTEESSNHGNSDSQNGEEIEEDIDQLPIQRRLITSDNFDNYNSTGDNQSDNGDKLDIQRVNNADDSEIGKEKIVTEDKDIDTAVSGTSPKSNGSGEGALVIDLEQRDSDWSKESPLEINLEETDKSGSKGEATVEINFAQSDSIINCNGVDRHMEDMEESEENGHGLVDSSISMRTDDTGRSLTSSFRDDVLITSTDSQLERSSHDDEFEDIIDLSVSNKNISYGEANLATTDDLLNFNSLDSQEENTPKTPIIAFEDNTVKRQDVTADLS